MFSPIKVILKIKNMYIILITIFFASFPVLCKASPEVVPSPFNNFSKINSDQFVYTDGSMNMGIDDAKIEYASKVNEDHHGFTFEIRNLGDLPVFCGSINFPVEIVKEGGDNLHFNKVFRDIQIDSKGRITIETTGTSDSYYVNISKPIFIDCYPVYPYKIVSLGTLDKVENFSKAIPDQFQYTSEILNTNYKIEDSSRISADRLSIIAKIQNKESYPIYFRGIKFFATLAGGKGTYCSSPDKLISTNILMPGIDLHLNPEEVYEFNIPLPPPYNTPEYRFCGNSAPIYIDTRKGCKDNWTEWCGKCYPLCADRRHVGEIFEKWIKEDDYCSVRYVFEVQLDCSFKMIEAVKRCRREPNPGRE